MYRTPKKSGSPTRACRSSTRSSTSVNRSRRAHLLVVTRHGAGDARPAIPQSTSTTTAGPCLQCAGLVVRDRARHTTCTALDLASIPLHATTAPTRTARAAGGHAPSARSQSPISSTQPCSPAMARSCSRSPTRSASGSRRAARGSRRLADELYRLAASGASTSRVLPVDYHPDGRSAGSPRTPPACRGGSTSTLIDLDQWPTREPSYTRPDGHERSSVEIFRRCTRGCRFCQAGMITRPVRAIDRDRRMVESASASRGWRRSAFVAVERRPQRDR